MVIIIIGIGKLFDMASGINGGIINISKHYRFGLYANLFLVAFIIVSNYLLIPVFGIIGAALASALSLFLYNLIKFVFVWYKFSMQPFKVNAIFVILAGVATLMLAQLVPPYQNLYIDLILRSCSMAIFYLGIIFLLNISEEMNRLVGQSYNRIKNYFDA
jgi:O-antigen/teichoic acid export membrane protein